MNTTYTLATIIVPADTVQMYRDIASSLSPSGAGMFVTPLYTGDTITHYISTGMIWQMFADLIADPELFVAETGVSLETAIEVQQGVTYLAIGTEGTPALHNKEAIAFLGLSLTPVEVSEEE